MTIKIRAWLTKDNGGYVCLHLYPPTKNGGIWVSTDYRVINIDIPDLNNKEPKLIELKAEI